MKRLTVVTLIAILTLGLAACKKDRPRRDYPDDPTPPTQDEPFKADFKSTTGRNVVENPNDTFHIPKCGSGKLGYVVARHPAPISGTMGLEYTYTASPDAIVLDAEDLKSTPGNMALFFQRQGDDYSQSKYDRGYRQWSLPRQKLTESGDFVFEVPLTPDKWNFGNVGFEATKNDVENVGFTLAGYGGPSAGHGVCMKTGTASIAVKNVTFK